MAHVSLINEGILLSVYQMSSTQCVPLGWRGCFHTDKNTAGITQLPNCTSTLPFATEEWGKHKALSVDLTGNQDHCRPTKVNLSAELVQQNSSFKKQ